MGGDICQYDTAFVLNTQFEGGIFVKKRWILTLAFLLCLVFTVPVMATPTVVLDGKQLNFSDAQPIIEDGRTLVPLRAIFEAMGAKVEWNQDTQTTTAIKGNTTVVLKIGSTTPTINGNISTLDVPAKIINGRTLVPLRFVGEAFGGTVNWDPATQVITISTNTSNEVNAGLPAATIVRIVDGDTIVAKVAGQEQRIRLILVDTPESVHPNSAKNNEYGKMASSFTSSVLKEGQTIYLQKDVSETDRYGRLLRYVWLSQPTDVDSETEVRAKMYNARLLLEGYAQIATFPPDIKYVDMFTKFQREARENNRGLWGYEQTVNTPVQQIKTTGKYIGSIKSDKYHYPDCRHAKNITKENETWFSDKAEAEATNYKPCGVCKP